MTKVSIAIIEREGRILIAKRKKNGPLKNLWEFPGGKIEPGETPEECVRREVLEELGLSVEIEQFICSTEYQYEHESVELFAYKVQYASGTPGTVHYQEMKWVNPYELNDYDFPGANAEIIQKLSVVSKARK